MRTTSGTRGTMWNTNIWIIEVTEEDKKKGHEKILEEIIAENFPKMRKEIVTQFQETQRVPNRTNPRRKYPKTHINQINKDQTQRTTSKSSKWETTNNTQRDTHKDNNWAINRNSSGQREWQGILKIMKENNLQPRLLYPARISFRYEGEFKSFTDKQELREFSTTKPALQKMLKDLL